MNKKVYDQLKNETEYQILSREIEIDILWDKLAPLRVESIQAKDKAQAKELNEAIAGLNRDINTYKLEIGYFELKLEKLEARIKDGNRTSKADS